MGAQMTFHLELNALDDTEASFGSDLNGTRIHIEVGNWVSMGRPGRISVLTYGIPEGAAVIPAQPVPPIFKGSLT